MRVPRSLAREVFIRLDGNEAFVGTVKYGRFYSRTKEVTVVCEASPLRLPERVPLAARYFVPPLTVPPGQSHA